MESFGSILEGAWSSVEAMYSAEESEFTAQLLNYCSIPNDLHFNSSFRIPSDNADIDHFALGNTCFYPGLNHDSNYAGEFRHILAENEDSEGENLSSVQIFSSGHVYENVLMQLELEGHVADPEKAVVLSNSVQQSKKRSANSGDVQKNKRSVKAKKNQKIETTGYMNNKEKNAAVQKRSLSNDSIASHELNGVESNSLDSKEVTTVNSIGEARAVRGSTTDPQSLYAKKRRERINEKFRTLQNLVPNGTKVDISTMLEDAVEYVKFLQLQIKILSSDKWMYAPITYNGTDLGLNSNLSRPLH